MSEIPAAEKESEIFCVICQKSIPEKLLLKHIGEVHFSSYKPFKCYQCEFRAGDWRILETVHSMESGHRKFAIYGQRDARMEYLLNLFYEHSVSIHIDQKKLGGIIGWFHSDWKKDPPVFKKINAWAPGSLTGQTPIPPGTSSTEVQAPEIQSINGNDTSPSDPDPTPMGMENPPEVSSINENQTTPPDQVPMAEHIPTSSTGTDGNASVPINVVPLDLVEHAPETAMITGNDPDPVPMAEENAPVPPIDENSSTKPDPAPMVMENPPSPVNSTPSIEANGNSAASVSETDEWAAILAELAERGERRFEPRCSAARAEVQYEYYPEGTLDFLRKLQHFVIHDPNDPTPQQNPGPSASAPVRQSERIQSQERPVYNVGRQRTRPAASASGCGQPETKQTRLAVRSLI